MSNAWGSPVVGRMFVLLGMLSAMHGCASAMNDKELGEPCTRTEQCSFGLVCSGGLCTEHKSRRRRDAGMSDEDAGESHVSQSEVEQAP